MTADEVLTLCQSTIGKPLTKLQTRIGIPRESVIGGTLMRKICGLFPDCTNEADLRSSNSVALTFDQFRSLEQELGRVLCNSGDVLFGMIHICAFDSDENPAEFLGDREWIDGRNI